MMKPALGPSGRARLITLALGHSLFAFDFDGTLAPIVDRPGDARVPPHLAARLARLARRWPVAILTGRGVHDVRARLGFQPAVIIGNHGAEESPRDQGAQTSPAIAHARALAQAQAAHWQGLGITLEDKGLSLALHFRLAPDPRAAEAALRLWARGLGPACQATVGKRVLNVTDAAAPDKAMALDRLVRRLGVQSALYVGDDVNDEPVFASAPAHWMTVHVGVADASSAAGYYVEEPRHVASLVDTVLGVPPPSVRASIR